MADKEKDKTAAVAGDAGKASEGAAPAAEVTVESDEPEEIKVAPKVKVTPGGGYKTAEFKGKRFTRDGKVFDVKALGWSDDDWRAAHKDPRLVIEPMEAYEDSDGDTKITRHRLADPRTVRAPFSPRMD